MEKAGWYVESPEQKKLSCPSTSIDFNQENCLQPSVHLALEIPSSQLCEFGPPTWNKRLATW